MYKNEQFGKCLMSVAQIDLRGFGARLKKERERLGLSIQEFATLGEVSRVTQMRYETEVNCPTIEYMCNLGKHGADPYFIQSGVRTGDLVSLHDSDAFCKAIDLIDELLEFHNFRPSAVVRGRAILNVYGQILRFGVKKAKPTLEELMNVGSEHR